ncbi:MAG: hypothetical protein BEN19_06025 [Epulopiscium sp. Nuni2H_MBin003]|nr:MAG: hypothetical protein BEN19_06025 [Epulopiscium sp. Nuni2H_MBin003]
MRVLYSFKIYLAILSALVLTFNSFMTSILVFTFANVMLMFYTAFLSKGVTRKIIIFISYSFVMIVQLCFCVFMMENELSRSIILASYLLLGLSFYLNNLLTMNLEDFYIFSSVEKSNILSFDKIEDFNKFLAQKKQILHSSRQLLTREIIEEVIANVRRNSSFSYINQGSLNEEYFEKLQETLADEYVYIVISDTGTPISKVMALGTKKPYNHASIAFDKKLVTLVSYNGGEWINPPGLNAEMVEYLLKKDESSIYVYKLKVNREQKQKMIDKIAEINKKGSAYNMIGLVTKQSYKPNIMYCSQFVYKLLEHAGATYFKANPDDVRPTDLIELDYDRKLELDYKIVFDRF